MSDKKNNKISEAVFYLLALAIVIYLAIWSLVNIVGIIGIGLTMWSIIKIYSKFRNGISFSFGSYKLELIALILGLFLWMGWFS